MITKTIVYLARHGETDWNRQNRWQGQTDIVLNDAGRAQAAALAERLRPAEVTRVHASDLLRARETGEIVAACLGAPFHGIDARLRERAFGAFEGLTREECEVQHPGDWERYRADPECLPSGAEAAGAVTSRMFDAVLELARGGSGPALLISHGGALRLLVSFMTRTPCPPIANTGSFRVQLQIADDPEEMPAVLCSVEPIAS